MKHPISAAGRCGACCTQVKHLSVIIEGEPILQDVLLHVHCGELTAIIGPNGAGKTTLFKALLGQLPYTGEIIFKDANDGSARTPRIGYVPQQLPIDRMAPVSVLDFFIACTAARPAFLRPTKAQRAHVLQALSQTGAQGLADKRLGALSGGEMQRVLLALAITPTPDLLLLDEPVSGMDVEGLQLFYKTVDHLRRTLDISILLVSHDFDMVRRYADRVVLIRHTVLAAGKPGEVLGGKQFAALFPGLMGEVES